MCIGNSVKNLIPVKVISIRPGTEFGAAQIYGVGTCIECPHHCFVSPCRGKKLNSFHIHTFFQNIRQYKRPSTDSLSEFSPLVSLDLCLKLDNLLGRIVKFSLQ